MLGTRGLVPQLVKVKHIPPSSPCSWRKTWPFHIDGSIFRMSFIIEKASLKKHEFLHLKSPNLAVFFLLPPHWMSPPFITGLPVVHVDTLPDPVLTALERKQGGDAMDAKLIVQKSGKLTSWGKGSLIPLFTTRFGPHPRWFSRRISEPRTMGKYNNTRRPQRKTAVIYPAGTSLGRCKSPKFVHSFILFPFASNSLGWIHGGEFTVQIVTMSF